METSKILETFWKVRKVLLTEKGDRYSVVEYLSMVGTEKAALQIGKKLKKLPPEERMADEEGVHYEWVPEVLKVTQEVIPI